MTDRTCRNCENSLKIDGWLLCALTNDLKDVDPTEVCDSHSFYVDHDISENAGAIS